RLSFGLNGFTERSDTRHDAVHRALESDLVRVNQHEGPAASHQVYILLLSVGYRVIHDFAVPAHSLKISERQNAIRVGQQSMDGHSVQFIYRRHRIPSLPPQPRFSEARPWLTSAGPSQHPRKRMTADATEPPKSLVTFVTHRNVTEKAKLLI
ncbi:MAG: hypothetical protein WBD98_14755, partial [Acidobacteriaceae bacterium]